MEWTKMPFQGCPAQVGDDVCPVTGGECTVGNEEASCPKNMSLNDALAVAERYLEDLCCEGVCDTAIYMARHRIRQRLGYEK